MNLKLLCHFICTFPINIDDDLKLLYHLDQWFSTAGPRTGAGPQQFILILLFKEAVRVQK